MKCATNCRQGASRGPSAVAEPRVESRNVLVRFDAENLAAMWAQHAVVFISYQFGDDGYEQRGRGDVAWETCDALTHEDDKEVDDRGPQCPKRRQERRNGCTQIWRLKWHGMQATTAQNIIHANSSKWTILVSEMNAVDILCKAQRINICLNPTVQKSICENNQKSKMYITKSIETLYFI